VIDERKMQQIQVLKVENLGQVWTIPAGNAGLPRPAPAELCVARLLGKQRRCCFVRDGLPARFFGQVRRLWEAT